MSLYLTIELCALAVPLIFSFDKKVAFYKLWIYLFPGILISAAFFIAVDIYFTGIGVWGFNPRYTTSLFLAGLPVEEILFFIIIPYCSIFIHYVFVAYFPDTALSNNMTRIISLAVIVVLSATALICINRAYTALYSAFLVVVTIITMLTAPRILNRYYITFLIILIPFFIVNGILTGSFIEDEVVWYNSSEITGFRIFTIPVEDILYGFSMILSSLLFMNIFQKMFRINRTN